MKHIAVLSTAIFVTLAALAFAGVPQTINFQGYLKNADGTLTKKAKEMVDGGVHNTDRLIAEATHLMSTRRRVRIIYASIVDPDTMEAVREVFPGKAMMAIAAWVDEVRLIDNILL